MKKLSLLIVMVLVATVAAMAQVLSGTGTPGTNTPPTLFGGDELGAHNGYGRGCVMCHAPHSGAAGNGVGTADTYSGQVALWGQNLTSFYSQSISFSGDGNSSKYQVTLPAAGSVSISDGASIVLLCLSCHDGSIATVGMMHGQTVEILPVVGGTAPTLLGTVPGNTKTYLMNDHPVGPSAVVSCGGSHSWDCTGGGATTQPIYMNGAASSQFLINYPASFWNGETVAGCGGGTGVTCKNPSVTSGGTTTTVTNTWGYNSSGNPLASFNGGAIVNGVTCTSCHNQHSMTVWSVGGKNYTTMFFVKGYYNPYNGGNSVAQFCRNCHGGNSNELEGLMNVPTT